MLNYILRLNLKYILRFILKYILNVSLKYTLKHLMIHRYLVDFATRRRGKVGWSPKLIRGGARLLICYLHPQT